MILASSFNIQEKMDRLEEMRGLEFKQPVVVKYIEKEELEPFLDEAIEDSYGGKIKGLTAWLAAMHVIEQDLDLEQSLKNLYMSQVAAFYNPKDHKYYVIKGVGDQEVMAELVAIHELTHALQDQYMELQKRLDSLVNMHDQQMALQSVLEGEATLTMMIDQLEFLGIKNQDIDIETLGNNLEMYVPSMIDVVGDFPPFLIHEIIFPYVQGSGYIISRMNGTIDWNVVDRIYQDPPRTTEEILHPERGKDPPVDFRDRIPMLVPEPWTVVYDNTLGESTFRYIFRKYQDEEDAARAAEGWDGDRVALLEHGSHRLLAWFTNWDSPEDRIEAEKSMKIYLKAEGISGWFSSSDCTLSLLSGDLKNSKRLKKRINKSISRQEETHGSSCSE